MPLLTMILLTVPPPFSHTLFKSDVTAATLMLREALEGPEGVMQVCGVTYIGVVLDAADATCLLVLWANISGITGGLSGRTVTIACFWDGLSRDVRAWGEPCTAGLAAQARQDAAPVVEEEILAPVDNNSRKTRPGGSVVPRPPWEPPRSIPDLGPTGRAMIAFGRGVRELLQAPLTPVDDLKTKATDTSSRGSQRRAC